MEIEIIVNGKSYATPRDYLTFEDVIQFMTSDQTPNQTIDMSKYRHMTMVWHRKHSNMGGSLCPGDSVFVEGGLVFDVADTSNA